MSHRIPQFDNFAASHSVNSEIIKHVPAARFVQ